MGKEGGRGSTPVLEGEALEGEALEGDALEGERGRMSKKGSIGMPEKKNHLLEVRVVRLGSGYELLFLHPILQT